MRVWYTISSSVTGRVFVHALDDHAERVADEDDVDAGLVGQRRERRVVRGDHDDLVLDRPACALRPARPGTVIFSTFIGRAS